MASLYVEDTKDSFLVSGINKWIPLDWTELISSQDSAKYIRIDEALEDNRKPIPADWKIETHSDRRVVMIPNKSLDLTEIYHKHGPLLQVAYSFTLRIRKFGAVQWHALYTHLKENFDFIKRECGLVTAKFQFAPAVAPAVTPAPAVAPVIVPPAPVIVDSPIEHVMVDKSA